MSYYFIFAIVVMESFFCFSGINSMQVVNIKWSGVLSWGYPDGVLRLKHKAKQSPINLIQTDAYHEVGLQ